jgi:DNA modification methylase
MIMEIRPYSKNAKKHPEKQIKQLAAIIKEVGWRQPVIVNQEGVIVVGHGRYITWQKYKDVLKPVWVMDDMGNTLHGAPETTPLTKEQETAYRLADNKLNESEWDMPLVIEELKGMSEPMLELTGFDKDLILEPDEKDDDIPENVPPKAKLGDLWALGEHRVLCGDSTDLPTVERLMDGKKADMVFTDPPYGMKLNADYSGMKGWHTGKKYDNVIGDHADFNNDFINNIFSIFADTKEKFLFGADYYVDLLPNFGKDGNWIVWDKRVDESKDKMFGSGFEMLWSQQKHQRRLLRGMWAGFMGDAEASKRQHPTQKPTKILVEIMQEYSADKDIVADLFLGSGSTLIAAQKTGRICYGMELEPKYVDVIIKRWEEYTGEKAVKL